jgi:uncharacterized spore protein YtfJ
MMMNNNSTLSSLVSLLPNYLNNFQQLQTLNNNNNNASNHSSNSNNQNHNNGSNNGNSIFSGSINLPPLPSLPDISQSSNNSNNSTNNNSSSNPNTSAVFSRPSANNLELDLSQLSMLVSNLTKSKYLPLLQTILQQFTLPNDSSNATYASTHSNSTALSSSNDSHSLSTVYDFFQGFSPSNSRKRPASVMENLQNSPEYTEIQSFLSLQEANLLSQLHDLLNLVSLIRPISATEKNNKKNEVTQQFQAIRNEIDAAYTAIQQRNSANFDQNNTNLADLGNNSTLDLTSALSSTLFDSLSQNSNILFANNNSVHNSLPNNASSLLSGPNSGKKPRQRLSTSGSNAGKKRGTLAKSTVAILKQWFFNHFAHPYPTEAEKHDLAQLSGSTAAQVNYWFINARVRIWRPLLEMDANDRHAQLLELARQNQKEIHAALQERGITDSPLLNINNNFAAPEAN